MKYKFTKDIEKIVSYLEDNDFYLKQVGVTTTVIRDEHKEAVNAYTEPIGATFQGLDDTEVTLEFYLKHERKKKHRVVKSLEPEEMQKRFPEIFINEL
jgi:carbamate kinase